VGVTYKALDMNLRCPVTLKVISERYLGDQSARLRFLREARAAASVRHPNVASVFHLGRTGENYFYAMEFVEGETLEKLIKRSGGLEIKLALEIASQIAAGLAAVHKQKLVHRDIKPSNIMASAEEGGAVTAKIIDLGLARPVNEPDSQTAISVPGGFAGTPEFASPEQFAGVGVDIRSDLYSLGITLWDMLAGEVPFRGTPAEVMYKHLHAPLPFEQFKAAPQPILLLVDKLLEKDPAQRFHTPNELLKAIQMVRRAVARSRTIRRQKPRANVLNKQSSRQLKLSVPRLPKRSVAVLPFESLSDNKGDTYFADGVQDEILSNLATVSRLKVISRTSVLTYRSVGDRDVRSIAEELGVAHVVEGTVRRHGKRVRIAIRLIDARKDEALWCESYDRDLTDVFAIQSQIAETVAMKLRARLSPAERQGIEEKPTNDLEAYDLYLQAKNLIAEFNFALDQSRGERLIDAVKLSEEAVRRDPKFALAYCLTATIHDYLYSYNFDRTETRRALAKEAVDAALLLRPDLPEVHLALAFHLYLCHEDFDRARVQIEIAEKGRPNNPDAMALTAYLDRLQGHWEKSTRGLEAATSLDPRNSDFLRNLAINYDRLRRYRAFEETYDRLIELGPDKPFLKAIKAIGALKGSADLTRFRAALGSLPPELQGDPDVRSLRMLAAVFARDWLLAKEILGKFPNTEFFFLGRVLIPHDCVEIWVTRMQGSCPPRNTRFLQARGQLAKKTESFPESPEVLSILGLIDAALGQKREAIQEAKRAIEMSVLHRLAEQPTLAVNLASVYTLINEPDLAFEQLAHSIEAHGGISYGYLKLDPRWDGLRNDPRFDQLLAQLAPKRPLMGPGTHRSR
jgi:serine/threonine protein kinase/tetratricopeptide (TPR) repeat protein